MNLLFFLLYFTFSIFVYFVLFVPALLVSIIKPKYKSSVPARLILYNNPWLPRDGVWFHVCSFGEAKALAPIIEALPGESLCATAVTQTGFDEISKYTKHARYLPLEAVLPLWIRPQKVLVVMEAELWYLLFAVASAKGAKTMLINARISDKSIDKYMRFAWLYRQIFRCIDEVYAQTIQDKNRLEQLGAKNVQISGNIKLAKLPQPSKTIPKPNRLIVCAASTHENEEELIMDSFIPLKQENPDAMLIVAPRHPERFDEVSTQIAKFADEYQYDWQRYSKDQSLAADIVLVDTLGELVNIYAISDVVVLGGAFEPIGGHNAAEAAQFGCSIVSGEHYHNQREIFNAIDGIQIVKKTELSETLLKHSSLPKTSITKQSDITAIVQSIKDVL